MKGGGIKMTKGKNNVLKSVNIRRLLLVVVTILIIPFVANFTIGGWNWGPLDFVIIGGMIFAAGFGIELASKKLKNSTYKIIATTAIVAIFLLIWVELAVDAISLTWLF